MDCYEDFLPILVAAAVPTSTGMRFLYQAKEFEINGEEAQQVWQILTHCNGYNNPQAIAEKSGLTQNLVDALLTDLTTLSLIVDSRQQYVHFHKISSYPSDFIRDLSNKEIDVYTKSPNMTTKTGTAYSFKVDTKSLLSKLLNQRRSCRDFTNEPLTRDQIGNICHYGYGYFTQRAVPSGGGLYPLKMYILVEKAQIDLHTGYYEYDAETNQLVMLTKDVDSEQLKYCFNSETLPFNSTIQIVIAADLERQAYKYGNRGYRLTLLDAGHVAQNISLYCAEHNLGVCELGGILDDPLAVELKLGEIKPLLALAVGKKSANPKTNSPQLQLIQYVEDNLVGNVKPVKKAGATSFPESAFFSGYAIYGDIQEEAGATSTSLVMAKTKAAIEAYERHQSGQIFYNVKKTPAKNLTNKWLDPRVYYPLTNDQVRLFNLQEFTESAPLDWVIGKTLAGTKVLVPTDLIFYPINKKRPLCLANSSGIAAFTTYEDAQSRALLELIERDALMRNWFARTPPNKIALSTLPVHEQKRVQFWQDNGREVHILDMESVGAVTAQVVIVGQEYPYFTCGAATSAESFDKAVRKAFREAENQLCWRLNNVIPEKVALNQVCRPVDHGILYAHNDYSANIEWLWHGQYTDAPVPTQTINELRQNLDIVTVDLSEIGSLIKVVRVFSPKLVPINFGMATYHTHPAVAKLDKDSLALPHYFA